MVKAKFYKYLNVDYNNMIPGDRNGSPDDCFLLKLFLGVFI